MNHYGHAWLASARDDDPRFVLGAMLPDWSAWVGSRLARADDPRVAAGLRFHHASDAAFHASPAFRALERGGAVRLRERGLPRGASRGAAHVGVELLLDGTLLDDLRAHAPYLAALDAARDLGDVLRWHRPGAGPRFRSVVARLRAQGLPRGYADPDEVARRVARSLDGRPRLRVPTSSLEALRAWCREAQAPVARAAPRILAETRRALAVSEGHRSAPAVPGGLNPRSRL